MTTKICITTPEYPPQQWGGLARTVGKTASHVRAMGLQVHVAQFEIRNYPHVFLDENRTTYESDGITVHRIEVGREKIDAQNWSIWDCPHNLTLQMMYQSLELLHAREKFALFHSFFLYPVGFVTGLLAKRFGVPSIATVVGNDVKKYFFSPEKVAVCKSGLENADRVVGLSRDLIDIADSLTAIKHKSDIIYNSVKISEKPAGKELDGKIKIGCAGIFKYAKGLPYLLKAVDRLSTRHDLSLELRGVLRDSERETYNYLMENTSLSGTLSFLEPVAHDKISEWFETIDLFVLPSVTEGCPNILMEAMASGLPCIATRTGANEELIEDRISGLLVPWGDSDALVAALEEMILDRELRIRTGVAGRKKMRDFSLEKEYYEWTQIYKELIQF